MSKKRNNLFKHTSKELAMDAFLCWLIEEAEENDRLTGFQERFVEDFLGIGQELIGIIKNVKADKQKNNADIVITIETDKGEYEAIFENKMWSTAHSNQLERYREDFKSAIKFIYLKLGYIHKKEREVAIDVGYTIKDAEDLYNLLHQFDKAHPFIQEFNEFLDDWFVTPQRMMPEILAQNKIEELQYASFQQFVMEKIYDELLNNGFEKDDLQYNIGANNDGSPWAQLCFSNLEKVYAEKSETLFFRIDRRSGKFYIRVNLYSKHEDQYWPQKKERLNRLRKITDNLTDNSELNYGIVHNSAKYETEVLILFFEDGNQIQNVISESSKIANELRSTHQYLKV